MCTVGRFHSRVGKINTVLCTRAKEGHAGWDDAVICLNSLMSSVPHLGLSYESEWSKRLINCFTTKEAEGSRLQFWSLYKKGLCASWINPLSTLWFAVCPTKGHLFPYENMLCIPTFPCQNWKAIQVADQHFPLLLAFSLLLVTKYYNMVPVFLFKSSKTWMVITVNCLDWSTQK